MMRWPDRAFHDTNIRGLLLRAASPRYARPSAGICRCPVDQFADVLTFRCPRLLRVSVID